MCLYVFLILLFVVQSKSQTPAGTVLTVNIESPALTNNLYENLSTREINIYLPPSYSNSEKKYPVVYFLIGHSDRRVNFLNGVFQGFRLGTSMNTLINSGAVKEMIFVLLDGMNLMDGSFYEDSPASGNWCQWVAEDVVSYIDNNYRTIPKREARALCGHSMGGFGAINIGMKHSDVFGIIYSMSPGLYDENGLKDQGMFSNETTIRNYLNKLDEWSRMEKSAAIAAFSSYQLARRNAGDWYTNFLFGYGAAFSPDPEAYPHYTKYPYRLENNELICDSSLVKNYENGYGGFEEKIQTYKENFLSFIDFTIEYGRSDEYQWICRGSEYTSQLLTDENIPHQLVAFDGGHGNKLRSRIEQFMLPRVSEKLEHDETASSIKEGQGMIYDFRLLQNYPNPFNPSTKIKYEINAGLDSAPLTKISVYNLTGEKITELVNEYKNPGIHEVEFRAEGLSSGVYYCVMRVGEFKESRKMLLLR